MNNEGAIPMKRATDRAAGAGIRRFALHLIGGVFILALAGCSGDNVSFDLGLTSAETSDETAQAEEQQKTKPIAFAPIIGAPSKISSTLNKLLKEAAEQKSIPVVSAKNADYTIRGYLVAQANPKGTKLSYIWDVSDKAGKRAKRFQGDELIEGKKGGNPWSAVDDESMRKLAEKTVADLQTWLPKDTAAPATASNNQPNKQGVSSSSQASASQNSYRKPSAAKSRRPVAHTNTILASAQPTKVVAVVPPVTGAPGDGVMSLTDAMKRHLKSAGVTVGAPGKGAYVVRGSVEMGAANNGQQRITIRWLVVGPNGQAMEKTVVQRNKVPEGSLNGSWGQVADLAASEAAKSVAKLIGQRAG
jgi:hypothetical protein